MYEKIVDSLSITTDSIMSSRVSKIDIQTLINMILVISQNKEFNDSNVVVHKIDNYKAIRE